MIQSGSYTIHAQPNWLFEAVSCISSHFMDGKEINFSNPHKFGLTEVELKQFLEKNTLYRSNVLREVVPIFKSYKSLEDYFKPTDSNDSFVQNLVMHFSDQLYEPLSEDELNHHIVDFISGIFFDSSLYLTEENLEINSINDLIEALSRTKMNDKNKMLMVNFYSNRYEIIEQIKALLSQIIPICQKYFSIIEADFNKSVAAYQQIKDLQGKLESSVGLKLNIDIQSEINVTIFQFNQISMNYTKSHHHFYIGMYVFALTDLKENNHYQDDQIFTDLKALSDHTRFKMMQLLAIDKMYLQQMAQSLDLTPATISHHITVLMQAELISVYVDHERTRKVYYEANTKKITKITDTLKNLLLGENNE